MDSVTGNEKSSEKVGRCLTLTVQQTYEANLIKNILNAIFILFCHYFPLYLLEKMSLSLFCMLLEL